MSSLALVSAQIWTGPEHGYSAEAIGFGPGGRVTAVGARRTVLAGLRRRDEVIEADGKFIVPGFVDAHVHVRAAAAAQLAHDCSAVRSAAELLSLVAARARLAPPSQLLSFHGLEPEQFRHDRLPTRAELDVAAGANPLVIRLRSLHGWMLNTRALDAAGLEHRQPALIVDHGGLLRRRLGSLVDRGAMRRALRSWSVRRLRDGVVAQLDASVTNTEADIQDLRRWQRDGVLAQAVAALSGEAVPSAAGVKVMPHSRQDPRAELRAAFAIGLRAGRLVAIHCLDLDVLGAIIDVLESTPADRRPAVRIEHAATCPPEWIPRLARQRVTVVTHPAFVRAHGDRYLADPTLEPHSWLYRLRSWLEAGIGLAVGSDAPAGPSAPAVALRAAIERTTRSGATIGSGESLSAESALAAMTAWAADHSRLEGYGRLQVGGPGAAVVLSEDPLRTGKLEIDQVICDGKAVRA